MFVLIQDGLNEFCGVILDSNVERDRGYAICDCNGKMNSPHPMAHITEKSIWLPLFDDEDHENAFIGEKERRGDLLMCKVWWD